MLDRNTLGRLRARAAHPREALLFEKFQPWTMISVAQFVENVALCRTVTVPGAVVECGCWRGGMSAAMASVLPGRRSVLFDSFEGLPPVTDVDGDAAARYMATGDPLVVSESDARAAMELAGGQFEIFKGWFEDTVPAFAERREPIAVLRLDGDWYDSTMVCLTELVPLVVPGGLIIIDDYDDWEGCTRAVHDYLSREQRPEPIERTRFGVVFLRVRGERR